MVASLADGSKTEDMRMETACVCVSCPWLLRWTLAWAWWGHSRVELKVISHTILQKLHLGWCVWEKWDWTTDKKQNGDVPSHLTERPTLVDSSGRETWTASLLPMRQGLSLVFSVRGLALQSECAAWLGLEGLCVFVMKRMRMKMMMAVAQLSVPPTWLKTQKSKNHAAMFQNESHKNTQIHTQRFYNWLEAAIIGN